MSRMLAAVRAARSVAATPAAAASAIVSIPRGCSARAITGAMLHRSAATGCPPTSVSSTIRSLSTSAAAASVVPTSTPAVAAAAAAGPPLSPAEVARLVSTWHVPAHGPTGKLVDLLLTGPELAAAKALVGRLPAALSWTLNKRQICDLELLANGGFSPLQGFMGRKEYESVVRTCKLPDGTLFPMPITLDVTDAFKQTLDAEATKLAGASPLWMTLKDEEGNPLALLRVEEVWQPNKSLEAQEVFGGDPEHPAIRALEKAGPWYVAGELQVLQLPVHYDHADLRRTPLEVRAEFARRGWKRVVAFQTRNPLHRAHFELTVRAAREADAALLLHPVVGQTKPGDIEHHVRVKCYRAIMDKYEPGSALLSALPLAMRMGGPREAVWHALIRQNYGCTHFILGRDHAGPGSNSQGRDFYSPFAARDYALQWQDHLKGIRLLPFDMMVYLPREQRYIGEADVAPGVQVEKLSGTEVRNRLHTGCDIPEWFSFPSVVDILRQAHPPRRRQGLCVFFTGLSGSGKSTIANALQERLLSLDARTVTLLDGDLVRQMLSSELTFTEAHRNLNIQRIGYVASLVVRAGGIVLAAPIAPYARPRGLAREACSAHGGFFEVYIAASLETCEKRDRKGLYARARAGTLKHFTGIDDPYEEPLAPDVRIDTAHTSVAQAVDAIMDKLVQAGFIGVDQLQTTPSPPADAGAATKKP